LGLIRCVTGQRLAPSPCRIGATVSRRTWTKFKEILPKLVERKHTSTSKGSVSGKRKAAVMSGVIKMMASAASKLRSANREIDGAKREKLLATLTDFVSAISASTGLRLSLKEDENLTVA
jgi:hypothetical protein